MITKILMIIIGLLFVLFIPGYLLSLILLKKSDLVERIVLSFGLSVFIVVLLGFFLTLIGNFLDIKGITSLSVWTSLIIVCAIFVVALFREKRLF